MSFYHVCFTVPDLEAAMRDLTAASGLGWRDPAGGRLGEWDYRIVFSAGGAPFVELIEAAPGGPWGDTSRAGFHHLGFWTSDLAAGTGRLTAAGLPETFSGCPHGRAFAYHRVDSIGAHVELVDRSLQASFLDTWNPGGPPMPAIEEAAVDGPAVDDDEPA